MLYLCILGNLTKYMIVSYDNLFFIGKAPKRHREKKKVLLRNALNFWKK